MPAAALRPGETHHDIDRAAHGQPELERDLNRRPWALGIAEFDPSAHLVITRQLNLERGHDTRITKFPKQF